MNSNLIEQITQKYIPKPQFTLDLHVGSVYRIGTYLPYESNVTYRSSLYLFLGIPADAAYGTKRTFLEIDTNQIVNISAMIDFFEQIDLKKN